MKYTNRKGDGYYLHVGKTRTGKPQYFFSRQPTDAPLDAIPEGFEIYESPEAGLVFLRRAKPVTIAPFEREMLCEAIRQRAGLEYFIVEPQEKSLVVYLPTASQDLPRVLAEGLRPFSAERARAQTDWFMRQSSYEKMMRLVLVDEDERLFQVERWCFRGSIDTWIFLDGPALLADLVNKYVKHLGKESFFELM